MSEKNFSCIYYFASAATGFLRQGFPTWGVGTPWGVRRKSRGCQSRFLGSNTKIRNLVPHNICHRREF